MAGVTNGADEQQQQEDAEVPQVNQGENNDRLLRLPLSRVKNIIKMDPDVSLASQEAVVAIAKAAELFIGVVSKDASYKTQHAKRKTLLKKDFETVLDSRDCYAFLEGAVD